jgi:hypothetical protein
MTEPTQQPNAPKPDDIADFEARVKAALAGAPAAEAEAITEYMRFRAAVKAYALGAAKSWTVVLNVVIAILAEAMPWAQEIVPQLASFLPRNEFLHVAAAVALLNIALRFKTRQALPDK